MRHSAKVAASRCWMAWSLGVGNAKHGALDHLHDTSQSEKAAERGVLQESPGQCSAVEVTLALPSEFKLGRAMRSCLKRCSRSSGTLNGMESPSTDVLMNWLGTDLGPRKRKLRPEKTCYTSST